MLSIFCRLGRKSDANISYFYSMNTSHKVCASTMAEEKQRRRKGGRRGHRPPCPLVRGAGGGAKVPLDKISNPKDMRYNN